MAVTISKQARQKENFTPHPPLPLKGILFGWYFQCFCSSIQMRTKDVHCTKSLHMLLRPIYIPTMLAVMKRKAVVWATLPGVFFSQDL
jgi:hypothetical protein